MVLGLVAELPRHGYQMDQEIQRRGMREWTPIGFSSVYFLLTKLERKALVRAKTPSRATGKRVYSITAAGRRTLVAQTLAALSSYRAPQSSLLLGMLHWSALDKEQALQALQARRAAVRAEKTRLDGIQIERQPLPDFVEALFNYSLGQLHAEEEWIARTVDYMNTKPWLK
ncbi:MAG: PadR family transcriptional regulator [Planctomycetales bacterium]